MLPQLRELGIGDDWRWSELSACLRLHDFASSGVERLATGCPELHDLGLSISYRRGSQRHGRTHAASNVRNLKIPQLTLDAESSLDGFAEWLAALCPRLDRLEVVSVWVVDRPPGDKYWWEVVNGRWLQDQLLRSTKKEAGPYETHRRGPC